MRASNFTSTAAALAVFTLVASTAFAESPDPRFTTVDPVVVGNASGNALGGLSPGFDVVVRDVSNNPVPGQIVTLDFWPTALRLSSVQSAGTTLNCAAKKISRVTDANGAVKFAARFGGYTNVDAIYVDESGIELGSVKARSTDIDGLDGKTGLGDFALFSNNFLGNTAAQETDFDLNGLTGLADFSLFVNEFLSGATAPYCP